MKKSKPIPKMKIRQWVEDLDAETLYLRLDALLDGQLNTERFDSILREALPKESYYQTKIMDAIREAYPKAFVWKAAAGPYSRLGIPDVCVITGGRYYGFEVKRPYIGEPSKIQEQTIELIRAAGGVADFVSFPRQALEIMAKEEAKHGI